MLTATILLAQALSPAPAQTAPTYPLIFLPRGTTVPVLVTKDVRVGAFGSNTQERKIRFTVAQDVIVNGYVIAKTGDLIEGHYTNQQNLTHRTFETTTSQEVTLDIDDAVNFCGDTIHLGFERTFVGGVRSGFLSFGVHGHDAVFRKGLILQAATDRGERSICAQATTATPAPLPRDMVQPDNQPPNQPRIGREIKPPRKGTAERAASQ